MSTTYYAVNKYYKKVTLSQGKNRFEGIDWYHYIEVHLYNQWGKCGSVKFSSDDEGNDAFNKFLRDLCEDNEMVALQFGMAYGKLGLNVYQELDDDTLLFSELGEFITFGELKKSLAQVIDCTTE